VWRLGSMSSLRNGEMDSVATIFLKKAVLLFAVIC